MRFSDPHSSTWSRVYHVGARTAAMLNNMALTRLRLPRAQRKTGPGVGGELSLIELIQRRSAAQATTSRARELQLGIGDDCAIVRPRPGEDLVITTDFSLEGRHFRRDWHGARSIGHRTLARGLSDLAAMGARPVAAFLSLALPASAARDKPWVEAFLDGLLTLAAKAAVPLAGGDTAGAPAEEVLADIALLGAVPRGQALRRDGARPGDRLYVTGALGGAAAQLAQLESQATGKRKATRTGRPETPAEQIGPHFFPEPRLAVGRWLVRHRGATAAIDLSDGLSTDLHHLCVASQVAAEVDTAALPLHPLLGNVPHEEALQLALHGGEDYELLFTADAAQRVPGRIAGTPIYEIGRVVAPGRGRPRVVLVDAAGRRRPLRPAGWEHLR